jgi:hypothetical protein
MKTRVRANHPTKKRRETEIDGERRGERKRDGEGGGGDGETERESIMIVDYALPVVHVHRSIGPEGMRRRP